MGPFELPEKLINEHGSAAVLREHIGLLKAQHAALQSRCSDLQAQNAQLESRVAQHQAHAEAAQQALHRVRGGDPANRVCAHCAHTPLQQVGTRPHPTFGPLGLKEAVCRCAKCGQDSFFELPLA